MVDAWLAREGLVLDAGLPPGATAKAHVDYVRREGHPRRRCSHFRSSQWYRQHLSDRSGACCLKLAGRVRCSYSSTGVHGSNSFLIATSCSEKSLRSGY